jgi:hypothetical protein
MRLSLRQTNILGWIGVTCIAFTWLLLLVPKLIKALEPVLDAIGPLQWLIVLAMIVLPAIAAKRGSKWWLAAAAAGVVTFVDFLGHLKG